MGMELISHIYNHQTTICCQADILIYVVNNVTDFYITELRDGKIETGNPLDFDR